jgi:hypothetical protein
MDVEKDIDVLIWMNFVVDRVRFHEFSRIRAFSRPSDREADCISVVAVISERPCRLL